MAQTKYHGAIYKNRNRYWWKVRLPGSTKYEHFPLKPVGAKFPTSDKAVAIELTRKLWAEAQIVSKEPGQTLDGVTAAYMQHCLEYYQNSREPDNVKYALDYLLDNTEVVLAEDFEPLELIAVRDKMIEKGWSLSTINERVSSIKRMFKWAASRQIAPLFTYQSIAVVENLKPGRSNAKDPKPIKPVPVGHVYAILPFMADVLAAMVEFQLLTGARSTEVCMVRPCDIETSGRVWLYKPPKHKQAYRGQERIIFIGPKAQEILRPYLKRKITDYCFTPTEGNGRQKELYNDHYNRNSYRRGIVRALNACNKDREDKVPNWHPHQLRHTAGTLVRKEHGREAARAFLGHRNPQVTDDYADVDMDKGRKAALAIG